MIMCKLSFVAVSLTFDACCIVLIVLRFLPVSHALKFPHIRPSQMCNALQPGQPSPVQPARHSSLNAFKVVRVAEDKTVGNTRPDAQPLYFNVYVMLCPRNV
jgi:hypothetical protein